MGSEQQETQKRMVKIRSYDGVVVEVPEAVAIQSVVIKHVVEDVGVEDPIPTPNVVGDVLSKAADYLEIQGLLDLCLDKVASAITQKTAEVIRRDFNIQNDFTPEEEEAILLVFSTIMETLKTLRCSCIGVLSSWELLSSSTCQ
ncbi:SKP1-like protein 11 [Ananas comosus]|uniref:SKP1-like protein 11 n=1 Tax=Ananas comosus TaxID=4615 RepID=A0A6P5F920_ANACO|nr:SKP1-like protein 11 [Ananas comosus]